MGIAQKFKQRDRTAHIAVELMDRFFMDNRSNKEIKHLTPRVQTIYLTTCFLIASKYDEIDDQLVFINDVQRYYRSTAKYKDQSPTYTEIVETERQLMHFFDWSISFATPYHFLEIFIAQGILFQNETFSPAAHQKLDAKCFKILEDILGKRLSFKNDGFAPSEVAALCVMKARQEIGLNEWPAQLKIVTRQCDLQLVAKFGEKQVVDLTQRAKQSPTKPEAARVLKSKGKIIFADRRQS